MKTCDQVPLKFNFGHFFQLFHGFLPPETESFDFQKNLPGEIINFSPSSGVDDKSLEESSAWEAWVKMNSFSFLIHKYMFQ